MFVSQAAEEPRPAGPHLHPSEGVLHVSLERVGQLELWLQKAQRSLEAAGAAAAGSSTMQDGVEQQLLACQVSPAHQGTRSLPGFTGEKMSGYEGVQTGLNEVEMCYISRLYLLFQHHL